MQISLHKNARTTPAVRAEIAASSESARVLAQRHGITEQTVYKWKKRDSVHDRSHTAHHLQTQLTPAQEIVVVHLRRALLLPLDDLLAVTREFICETVSRSRVVQDILRKICSGKNGFANVTAQYLHNFCPSPKFNVIAFGKLNCRFKKFIIGSNYCIVCTVVLHCCDDFLHCF